MDDTRILMVVTEEEAKAAYEKALRELNVSYDVAGSFNEVLGMTIERAYSGLLIDILTLVRSSKEEKTIAYECINYYPSLRVKWDARTKRMNLSPLEQSFSADAGATLGFFIEQRCRAFAARPLRRHNRRETVLSLLLSTSADFTAGETVKSFTVNISRGGAFVHMAEPCAQGETVWLRFSELPELGPLKGVVCWRIEWGACRSIPGVGVMFDGLSEEQEKALAHTAGL